MSSNELLIAKGRLQELEKQYQEFEMKAESLLIQLREILNPLYNFIDLDMEKTLLLAKEFRLLQLNARECLSLIKKIKDTYNI